VLRSSLSIAVPQFPHQQKEKSNAVMGGEGAGGSNGDGMDSVIVVVSSSSPHTGVHQPVLQCAQLHAEGGGPVCPWRLLPELQGKPPTVPPTVSPCPLVGCAGRYGPYHSLRTHVPHVQKVKPPPDPNEEGYA